MLFIKKRAIQCKINKELDKGSPASILSIIEEGITNESNETKNAWDFRAITMLKSILDILTWARDKKIIKLTVKTLIFYLDINNIVNFHKNNTAPEEISSGITDYLSTIPNFDMSLKKQSDLTEDYYDYIKMIAINILLGSCENCSTLYHIRHGLFLNSENIIM